MRSGALVSLLAIYNQQVIASIERTLLPKPGHWADSNRAKALEAVQKSLPGFEKLNLAVILLGTLIWGYGDLLF